MLSIKFSIATPERLLLEKEISQVTLPTTLGEITVLPHHLPIVGILTPGTLTVKTASEIELLAVAGGFFKVDGKEVRVLADSAEHGDELDIAKIEEAKAKAERAIEEARDREDVDYSGLVAILEREVARLKTARKHLSHRHEIHSSSEVEE